MEVYRAQDRYRHGYLVRCEDRSDRKLLHTIFFLPVEQGEHIDRILDVTYQGTEKIRVVDAALIRHISRMVDVHKVLVGHPFTHKVKEEQMEQLTLFSTAHHGV